MKHLQALVGFVVIGVFAPALAHAQRSPALAPESKIWIGGNFGLSPVGSLEASAIGATISRDAATAVGLGGAIEYRVTPNVSIGFAPAMLLNVKPVDENDSGSELDLPLRLAVGAEVAPRIRLYGFGAPGYSILFPPPPTNGDTMHPSGFMIGFGGGAGYRIAPRLVMSAELGYQFRFLSTSMQNIDISFHANYLTFSVGVAAAID